MNLFKTYKNDLPASLVVFLVALPLCLGIALASGAPLFSGLITGIIGGIVVGFLSDSKLSVSGPAAGLTVIVFSAIATLGSFEAFLLAVVISGIIQLVLGYVKAGVIGHFSPVSVVNGMLTAIGLNIFLKQIPHAFGYDLNDIDLASFQDSYGHNTLSELYYMLSFIKLGPVIISIVSLIILYSWDSKFIKQNNILKLIPAPLVVVFVGIGLNTLFNNIAPEIAAVGNELVSLPNINSFQALVGELRFPNFSSLGNPEVYMVAATIAIVGSLESLLSLDAADKLDPAKRISSPNQELKAQGWGNILAGLIGGLPMTAVVVRTSANINAGGKGKLSSIAHGVLIVISVLFLASFLNLIPLAALAAILIQVGLKLNKISIYKKTIKSGSDQYIPFFITLLVIMFTDLLKGISVGVLVGLVFTLKTNFRSGVSMVKSGKNHLITINRNLYFFNKAQLRRILQHIPRESEVLIDGTKVEFMDYDIQQSINDFVENAANRAIHVELKMSSTAPMEMFRKTN
ncbi:SulP family inorganic anion transporter [Prolixibacteraceae bacterium Z1-6]|uniref:SulP family inorganic anion transporter n=1 Tax=Draconibacterium aestuarii TaxID=2998507 RepID=A0A9X3FA64_9BACT|nr:SulP family inorganic anion transporter [Prolixibacteraceae bacterium Z1-6]